MKNLKLKKLNEVLDSIEYFDLKIFKISALSGFQYKILNYLLKNSSTNSNELLKLEKNLSTAQKYRQITQLIDLKLIIKISKKNYNINLSF